MDASEKKRKRAKEYRFVVKLGTISCALRSVTGRWAAWWRSTGMWVRGWGWISVKRAFHSHGRSTGSGQPVAVCLSVCLLLLFYPKCASFLTHCCSFTHKSVPFMCTCTSMSKRRQQRREIFKSRHKETAGDSRIILPLVAERTHCSFRMPFPILLCPSCRLECSLCMCHVQPCHVNMNGAESTSATS